MALLIHVKAGDVMNFIYTLCLILTITGCASFPVPSSDAILNCSLVQHQKNNDQVVLEFGKNMGHGAPRSDYINYSKAALADFKCFEVITVHESITESKEADKIYFLIDRYTPEDGLSSFNYGIFSLLTLGIVPTWTTINTDLRIIEYREGVGEVELAKFHHQRTQIFSIFVAPVGLYRMIQAPSGVNANEMAQIKTNKYLFGEAIKELIKKKYISADP